ncbi:hypothetical protein ACF0H5_022365 [Mactra antiquata]
MLACFWVSCFDLGLQPVTGTFFDAMLEYYGSDRTTTASVSGLFTAVNQCSALGVAIMFVCSFTMIREVCSGPFKKWLALCLTLNSSFISFAGFSLPYLITFLNDRYALPGVFLAFGGILTNNVCVSLLFYFISKQIDTDSVKSRKELEDTKKQTIQTVETKDSSSLSIAYSNKLVDDNYECDSNAEQIHDTSIVTQELPEKQCSINGTFDVLKKTKTGIFFIELQTLRIIQRRFIDGVTRTKELMFGHVNIMFACLFLGVSLAMGTFDSYATIIIDMLESKGFPQDMAIHAYIPLNVCALISRILPGIITAIDPLWVVVMLACFWVSWFDFGLQTVTGAFFDVMLEYYGSDRTTTASVAGLFTTVNQGFGIIVGLLVQKFGIWKMSFIGAILIPLGFILSAFADSVIHVLLCFGVITAHGVAIMFVCSVTMIREVCSGPFKKWLALCLTLNSSCISFAGFSLPYLITFLNDMFALPGTFLAFGGILTNNVCVSLLFYFISKQIDIDSVKSRKKLEDTKKQTIQTVETKDSPSPSISYVSYSNELVDDNYECESNAEEIHDKSIVTHELPETSVAENHINIRSDRQLVSTESTTDSKQKYDEDIYRNTNVLQNEQASDILATKFSGINVLDRNEIFDAKQCSINGTFDVLKKTKTNSIFIQLQRTIKRRLIDGVTRAKELMFGHVNMMFACLFLGVSLAMGTFNSYATIIIDMLESKGFPQNMAIHAYIPLNVCALICRILPGIITAIDPLWFVVFYSFCGTAGQVILLISSNYAICMVAVGLTGMTVGGVISAATIVVAKSVDIEKFAVAFGQILTGVGIVVTIMTPMYGALRDTWGNYDIVLITTGIIQSLVGLLCIIGWIVNRKNNVK